MLAEGRGGGPSMLTIEKIWVRLNYPAPPLRRWGEQWTLTGYCDRQVVAERLIVSSPDYLVESLEIGSDELLRWPVDSAFFTLPALPVPLNCAVVPRMPVRLRVRSYYRKPARPWFTGSRAERKAKRRRFWLREPFRQPSILNAALVCRPG